MAEKFIFTPSLLVNNLLVQFFTTMLCSKHSGVEITAQTPEQVSEQKRAVLNSFQLRQAGSRAYPILDQDQKTIQKPTNPYSLVAFSNSL